MNKFFTCVLALVASVGFAIANTSFDFSSAVPAGWSVNPDPFGYETTGTSRGAQFTSSTELVLPDVSDLTNVTILCSTNGTGNSIEVKVGNTSLGSKSMPKENAQTLNFTSSSALNGDLKIIVTRAAKSIWIKTVTIDGTVEVQEIPGDEELLDSTYVYAEPTVIANTDSVGSNKEYRFVSNNILVHVAKGAQLAEYFGVNAGSSITFTATRPMKAIVVNGLIKKDFEAEASAGDMLYADASEEDFEAEQVLAVTDIDATSLTIECEKQMRCYSVSVYFEANPDSLDIDPGSDDGEYTFEWEPTETKVMNITFDTVEVTPMTEALGYACTGLYFMNDDYEMELTVFADIDSLTILPVGVYPIDTTYADNTVMASPGGNDEYDFPSCLMTDFYLNGGEWFYETTYYLASGALTVQALENGVQFVLNATSHFGSTVNATYTISNGGVVEDAVESMSVEPRAMKILREGQLLIRHNNATYTVGGKKL